MKGTACYLSHSNEVFIDHLVPISDFLKIPLITYDDNIANLIEKYYQNVDLQIVNPKNICLYIVKNFQTIIACHSRKEFLIDFGLPMHLLNKKIETIWVPHGNSDKGKTCYFFEALKEDLNILIYSNKMKDLLYEKKVLYLFENVIAIGNYRLEYYKKNKKFFDKIIYEEISKYLNKNKKTILYCPTWKDKEDSSSFFKYYEKLFFSFKNNFNLIVKLHPNSLKVDPHLIFVLRKKYKNILFLDNITLIYSLLQITDIYLGDFSSIGYDFLYFNRPMFFLKNNENLHSNLYECGYILEDNFFENIEKLLNQDKIFHKKRKDLYNYTFGNHSLENIYKILK